MSSRSLLPFSPMTVMEDFLPNGGLASTTLGYRRGGSASESRTSISDGPFGLPTPCTSMFIAASRAVPSTSSVPVIVSLASRSRWSGVSSVP